MSLLMISDEMEVTDGVLKTRKDVSRKKIRSLPVQSSLNQWPFLRGLCLRSWSHMAPSTGRLAAKTSSCIVHHHVWWLTSHLGSPRSMYKWVTIRVECECLFALENIVNREEEIRIKDGRSYAMLVGGTDEVERSFEPTHPSFPSSCRVVAGMT